MAPESARDGLERPTATQAVESMLGALQTSPKHDALIHLARVYAAAIDDGDDETLSKLGHRLESVCVKLGVQPAKAAGGDQRGGVSALDAFRARRA